MDVSAAEAWDRVEAGQGGDLFSLHDDADDWLNPNFSSSDLNDGFGLNSNADKNSRRSPPEGMPDELFAASLASLMGTDRFGPSYPELALPEDLQFGSFQDYAPQPLRNVYSMNDLQALQSRSPSMGSPQQWSPPQHQHQRMRQHSVVAYPTLDSVPESGLPLTQQQAPQQPPPMQHQHAFMGSSGASGTTAHHFRHLQPQAPAAAGQLLPQTGQAAGQHLAGQPPPALQHRHSTGTSAFTQQLQQHHHQLQHHHPQQPPQDSLDALLDTVMPMQNDLEPMAPPLPHHFPSHQQQQLQQPHQQYLPFGAASGPGGGVGPRLLSFPGMPPAQQQQHQMMHSYGSAPHLMLQHQQPPPLLPLGSAGQMLPLDARYVKLEGGSGSGLGQMQGLEAWCAAAAAGSSGGGGPLAGGGVSAVAAAGGLSLEGWQQQYNASLITSDIMCAGNPNQVAAPTGSGSSLIRCDDSSGSGGDGIVSADKSVGLPDPTVVQQPLLQPPPPLPQPPPVPLGRPAAYASRAQPSGMAMRKSQSALELNSWRGGHFAGAGDGIDPHDPGKAAVKLTPEERLHRILRYRQKRDARNFQRTIKYQCRKTLADTRPRVNGRFARNDEPGSVMPHETKKAQRERQAREKAAAMAAATATVLQQQQQRLLMQQQQKTGAGPVALTLGGPSELGQHAQQGEAAGGAAALPQAPPAAAAAAAAVAAAAAPLAVPVGPPLGAAPYPLPSHPLLSLEASMSPSAALLPPMTTEAFDSLMAQSFMPPPSSESAYKMEDDDLMTPSAVL